MKRINRTEADQLLNKLGDKVVELYDGTLKSLSFQAPGGNPLLEKQWNQFLAQQPASVQRQDKATQYALEVLLHDILFCLQEQREFRIQAVTKDGSWVNIDEYSDGIHGDLITWLEEKSEYGCVSSELARIETEG